MTAEHDRLRAAVRSIPDFPKPGILFRDLTPILGDAALLELALEAQLDKVRDLASEVHAVVGMESRGFWFGPMLARELNAAFVPLRKPGKLPAATHAASYGLEYGEDQLEMHVDALRPGQGVLIVDDLLATGGTARAACELVEAAEARVHACLFLVELEALKGRAKLSGQRIESVLVY